MNPQQATAQGVGVSFQLFYDELSPYGQWVEYPGYNYVWIPDAGPDFSPYATSRTLGAYFLRMDMGVGLPLGLGSVPLWTMVL